MKAASDIDMNTITDILDSDVRRDDSKNNTAKYMKAFLGGISYAAVLNDAPVFIQSPPTDAGLVYSGSPYTFFKGESVSITPAVSGTFTSCTVSPALSLGTTTCAVSGIPSALSSSTAYTITANTATGSKTASISIAVYFSRTWSEVQPILTSQAGMGSNGAETSYTFGSLAGISKW